MSSDRMPLADFRQQFITVKEAARLTTLSTSMIRKLIRNGRLRATYVERRLIIRREHLQAMIEAGPTGARPTPAPRLPAESGEAANPRAALA